MHCLLKITLCSAALALSVAHAAEPNTPKPASAADAGARVPETRYESAFSSYQPYREQKLAPWRSVNDDVHKAGGHLGVVGGASGKPAVQHPPEHKK